MWQEILAECLAPRRLLEQTTQLQLARRRVTRSRRRF